jgi:hypothetical protein
MNTTINEAWQEGGRWNGSSALHQMVFGTLITGQQQGTATTANNNGFDFGCAISNSSASVRSFVPGTGGIHNSWQSLSSTTTPNAFNNHQLTSYLSGATGLFLPVPLWLNNSEGQRNVETWQLHHQRSGDK